VSEEYRRFIKESGDRHATSDANVEKAVLIMNNLWKTNHSRVKDTYTIYVNVIIKEIVFLRKNKRRYFFIAPRILCPA
jgi:hypothetical protein